MISFSLRFLYRKLLSSLVSFSGIPLIKKKKETKNF